MRPPTIVNQPPINLLPHYEEEDTHSARRLGELFKLIPRFSSEYLARLHRGDVPTNKLDIISDGHIYELHLTAQQHGCTPSDVALSERASPSARTLSPSKLRKNFCPRCAELTDFRVTYVTQDHNGMTCEQYTLHLFMCALFNDVNAESIERVNVPDDKAQREEQKELAREAEWQRELATWPQYAPYCPPSPVEQVTPVTQVPFGLGESPRTCTHLLLREFKFANGQTIKMCPDCTKFDKQRVTILKAGKLADARMKHTKQQWEERLEAEGLRATPQRNPIVLFRHEIRTDRLEAIEHAQAGDNGKASPARNKYRASQLRKQVKPNTEAQRNCTGCGTLFVPNHASRTHCYDENCRKRQSKRKKRNERG